MSNENKRTTFGQLVLAGLLSSSFFSATMGLVGLKYSENIKGEIKQSVQTSLYDYQTDQEWQRRSLVELFAPLDVNLERSKRAFNRWQGNLRQEELVILQETNVRVRKLILDKYYLIPSGLQKAASTLVEHYDIWLQFYNKPNVNEYDAKFINKKLSEEWGKLPFPKESAGKLRQHFIELQSKVITGKGIHLTLQAYCHRG